MDFGVDRGSIPRDSTIFLEVWFFMSDLSVKVSSNVKSIVDEAWSGALLSLDKVFSLLSLDPVSEDANFLREVALNIGKQASLNKGYVFGQIGLDKSPCPENCCYCSFAESNSKKEGYSKDERAYVISEEKFVECLESFKLAGVDGVSLMGTAALSFDDYLKFVKVAFDVLDGRSKIIINYKDLPYESLRVLREAGADVCYHTIRIFEGKITGILPSVRKETIKNAKEAGLTLMNGVEPVFSPFNEEVRLEVARRIEEAVEQKPWATGVCGLIKVKGSSFNGKEVSNDILSLVAAVLRLCAGTKVEVGCVGGVKWVDAGEDPRERGYADDRDAILSKVIKAKEALRESGWNV